LNKFVKDFLKNCKINILRKLGRALVLYYGWNAYSWVIFLGGDFIIFRPKVRGRY
jgi:hypothetical protein